MGNPLDTQRRIYHTTTIEKIDSLREVTVYGYIHQMEDQLLSLKCTQFPHGIILIIIEFYGNKTFKFKFDRIDSPQMFRQQRRYNNRCIREIDLKLRRQKREKKKFHNEMKALARRGQIKAARKLAKNVVGMKDINENYTELKSTIRAFSNYLRDMNSSNDIFREKHALKISRLSKKCGVTCQFTQDFQVCHLCKLIFVQIISLRICICIIMLNRTG